MPASGGGGADSNDSKKAWPSLQLLFSILLKSEICMAGNNQSGLKDRFIWPPILKSISISSRQNLMK
jgi:hypothetical protein